MAYETPVLTQEGTATELVLGTELLGNDHLPIDPQRNTKPEVGAVALGLD